MIEVRSVETGRTWECVHFVCWDQVVNTLFGSRDTGHSTPG
jgi:hypothetical protein